MILTPASLRSDHWMPSSGIGGGLQLESLAGFPGIRTWFDYYGETYRTAGDVVRDVNGSAGTSNENLVALADAVRTVALKGKDADARILGDYIAGYLNRIQDGMRFEVRPQAESSRKAKQWRVRSMSPDQQSGLEL